MRFWPMPADVTGQDWAPVRPAPDGPTLGNLVVALVPAFRALFLLGYRAVSLNVTPTTSAVAAPTSWTSIDMQTLVLSTRTADYPRPRKALNVAFELEEQSDDDPDVQPPGFGMPLPAERLGTDVLGAVQPLDPKTGLPSQLQTSIDNFVGQAVIALIPRMPKTAAPAPNGTPQLPKTHAGGMVWIFDPEHWRRYLPRIPDEPDEDPGGEDEGDPGDGGDTGGDGDGTEDSGGAGDDTGVNTIAPAVATTAVTDVMKLLVWSMTQDASRVLVGQVYGRRGTPDPQPEEAATLDWLFRVIMGDQVGLGEFSVALRQHLQGRGDSHLLNESTLEALFWSRAAFRLAWLDVLVELLCRGVIRTYGLLDLPDPPEPLVAIDVSPTEVHLLIWSERTIVLRREVVVNASTTVRGSTAWEYIPGDPTVAPCVAVVAGRGISVFLDDRELYGWELQVFRVQSDALVPDPSAQVEPWTFLTSKLVEDPWEVATPVVKAPVLLARPLRDGLHLEFPVFGDVIRPPDDEEVDDDKPLPFAIRLTVDPMSARHWYGVDVSYYTYTFEDEERLAAHVVVWCTPGVTVTCSEAQPEDANPNSPTGIVNGAMASHNPMGTNPLEPPWRVSAEFWQTGVASGFPDMWAARLPVTYDLVTGFGLEPLSLQVPALAGTRGADTVPYSSPDGAIHASLTRRPYVHEVFFRHEGQVLDLIDDVIGSIPIIGDIVDAAETVNAWQTATDKWGRPVSTFQIALMTVCTAIPFVSGGFASDVARWVADQPDALLRGSPLSRIFGLVAAGFELGEPELKEVLHGSERFARSRSKRVLVDALDEFIQNNPRVVGDFVTRITNEGGPEWLTISDLRHPTRAGFVANLLDDDFHRYRSFFPTATEEQYLAHGLTGQTRVLAECLLGPTGIRRTVPRATSVPFVAYTPSPGPFVTVTQIAADHGAADVVEGVRRIAQQALDRVESMRVQTVNHAGHAVEASALVKFTSDDVAARATDLLNLVTDNRIDAATADQLRSVLGNDELNGVLVTLDERNYRLTESIVTGMYEATRIADDASVLAEPAMRAALRDYVRQMVGRPRFPWGPRFELRTSAALVTDFRPEIAAKRIALAVQQLAPDVRGVRLRASVDVILHVDLRTPSALAYPIQLKAVKDLDSASTGAVRLLRDSRTKKILAVRGPDIVSQAVADEVRRAPWDGWLPPADLKGPPPLTLPNDPLGAGWVRDSEVRVLILDDEHLLGHLLQTMYDTAARMGTGGVRVDLNDLDIPNGLRLSVQQGLLRAGRDPAAIDLEDLDLLVEDLADDVIPTIRLHLEAAIEQQLGLIPLTDIPFRPKVHVLLASEGMDPVREIIGKTKP
jgi:hypothetical protein